MIPRLLAEAVGIMELPVTEMEGVGRGAVLTLSHCYWCVCCGPRVGVRCRSQEFGFGRDEIEVHFRHPSGDADRPMDVAAGVAGSELSGTHTPGVISKWTGLRGHLASECRQKGGVTETKLWDPPTHGRS